MSDEGEAEDIEEKLRELVEVSDGVPPAASATARELFAWRQTDQSSIALRLSEDLQPVRDAGAEPPMEFTFGEWSVVLRDSGSTITGLIEPWTAGFCTLRFASGASPVEVLVGGEGGFEFGKQSERAIVQLEFAEQGRIIQTGWFLLSPA